MNMDHSFVTNLKLLEEAEYFFAEQYNVDVDCNFIFNAACLGTCRGVYNFSSNLIEVYGISTYSQRELAITTFHELIHYWQHKIVKTLDLIGSRCFYKGVDVSDIEYGNLPHEIEARKLSANLIYRFELKYPNIGGSVYKKHNTCYRLKRKLRHF